MIRIKDLPTDAPDGFEKDSTRARMKSIVKQIGQLQRVMYAEEKHSLLVVFQGMDSSGKDGASRKVFRYCSITGISAKSFKKPHEVEMQHDFLWRVHQHAPKKGRIQLFNRSHYEDVLIQRVHSWIDEETVSDRFDAINAFERNLRRDNNTTILKFFLNISNERQKEKLQERIDDPTKQWKHNPGDWEERKHWDAYMQCYEDVLNRSEISWIVVPADKRWYRDYFVATEVLKTLESLDLQLPTLKTES